MIRPRAPLVCLKIVAAYLQVLLARSDFCIATIAPTLGDVNTLIMHPYTMSHRNVPSAVREKYGISEGLIRVSVGIEAIDDLIHDFRQSLAD